MPRPIQRPGQGAAIRAQGNVNARNPIFKSSLSSFRAVRYPLRETGASAVVIPVADTSKVQPPIQIITVTALSDILSLLDVLTPMVEEDENEGGATDEEIIGAALSIICSVTPQMVPSFVKELRRLAFNIETKTLSSVLSESIKPAKRLYLNLRECLIVFGQVVLMLIKNMTEANFVNYFAQRTKAMRARVGIKPSNEIEVFFPLQDALTIRSLLGGHPAIREFVLRMCIDLAMRDAKGLVGQICDYICDMAAWTDMTPLVFVYENLVLPSSPIMRLDSLRSEVVNVVVAYDLVDSFEYPQFFRLLAPSHLQADVLRSKFPTLVAVAQRLRAEQFNTVGQFAGTIEIVPHERVEELVAIHKAGMAAVMPKLYAAALQYLDDQHEPEQEQQAEGVEHEGAV